MAAGHFGRTLAQLRRQAGFASGYSFYHDNGGRKSFPFTYVHYARLEKGTRLPRAGWLPLFIVALRLTPGAAGCRAILLAYLRDLFDDDRAFNAIVPPLLAPESGAAPPPGGEALRWMKSEHAVHLTPEEFRAVASDAAAYWCSEVLFNDRGSWTAEALARLLDLPLKDVRAGLARLRTARLIRPMPGGGFRSRAAGKFYTFPGRLPGLGAELKAIEGYWREMRRRRGSEAFARVELVRAEAGSMRRYGMSLAEALDAANTLAVHASGEDTGLYLVEATIRRLMPF